MDDLKEFLVVICIMVFVVVLTLTPILFIGVKINQYHCEKHEELTNNKTNFIGLDQCYENIGNQWILIKQVD